MTVTAPRLLSGFSRFHRHSLLLSESLEEAFRSVAAKQGYGSRQLSLWVEEAVVYCHRNLGEFFDAQYGDRVESLDRRVLVSLTQVGEDALSDLRTEMARLAPLEAGGLGSAVRAAIRARLDNPDKFPPQVPTDNFWLRWGS